MNNSNLTKTRGLLPAVAALGLGMHSIPEDAVDDNWSGGSITLRFSATMN